MIIFFALQFISSENYSEYRKVLRSLF